MWCNKFSITKDSLKLLYLDSLFNTYSPKQWANVQKFCKCKFLSILWFTGSSTINQQRKSNGNGWSGSTGPVFKEGSSSGQLGFYRNHYHHYWF